MVKMFYYKFIGGDLYKGLFTNGQEYVGRVTKQGEIAVLNDKKQWNILVSNRMTINRMYKNFEETCHFYVKDHKEAVNYRLEADHG
jgi:hypothetical protein